MTKDQRFCYILFYYANHESKENKTTHIHKLDECVFYTSNNSKSVVIVSDTSIKNNITISITHVHSLLNPVKKMIHYAVNIMSTEAELFAIRYSINQTIQISNVIYIIIVTDAIHIAHHIFDSLINTY